MLATVLLIEHLMYLGWDYPGQREQEQIVPVPKVLP